jgi:2-keto-4-pentenoate hydratase
MVADPSKLGGPMLAMINVGARAGVVGKAIPIKATPALADAFATMTVTLTDNTGSARHRQGQRHPRQPLNAASWLARDLAAAGTPLKRGDLLSLGSFTKLFPPTPGMAVTAKYEVRWGIRSGGEVR